MHGGVVRVTKPYSERWAKKWPTVRTGFTLVRTYNTFPPKAKRFSKIIPGRGASKAATTAATTAHAPPDATDVSVVLDAAPGGGGEGGGGTTDDNDGGAGRQGKQPPDISPRAAAPRSEEALAS